MYEQIDNKTKMKKEHREKDYQVLSKVTGGDIENILIKALETESHNRVCLSHKNHWVDKPSWLSTLQYATQILLEGGAIQLKNVEDPIVYHELTLQKLFNGINAFMYTTLLKSCINIGADELLNQLSSADAKTIISYSIYGRG